MGIIATLYIPPHGRTEPMEICDIDKEDEVWFRENNAKISAEVINDQYVVYADVGLGEEYEAIEVSRGRSCAETMHALRAQAQRLLENAK